MQVVKNVPNQLPLPKRAHGFLTRPGVHLGARPEGQRLDSADYGQRIVFQA